ncbi:MAG: bifunctional glutamate N-acetyltransferase/amino-acid acetyltransferase ArgJ [Deltaproteobacteria bacterium]|nr:bifunctional glutamate N-acetyltransferase/amino-acid acetyltransferase ArgJ [Deltaproteobacteria bacterium]
MAQNDTPAAPVPGFRAASAASGMRYRNRPDLGLIVADPYCGWSGVFTRNLCAAAPVLWSRERGRGRAILANAGQANAQTGERGLEDARISAEALSRLLGSRIAGVGTDDVLLASTGVIGQPVNMEALLAALPGLVEGLSPGGLEGFSRAILTTDTVPKAERAEVKEPGGASYSIWGCVKGSGMIAPDMATMLGFVLTDRPCSSGFLRQALREATDLSFNRITVDGDTSTNDSVFLVSSGAAGGPALEAPGSPGADLFREGLAAVLRGLARRIVDDGEGATKTVTVTVRGAASDAEALRAARAVAGSPLVKTAFFGEDANWGRVLAALGRSGAALDPYRVDLYLDSVPWVKGGVDNGREAEAQEVMRKRGYSLTADLHAGPGEASVLTCDLSHGYVTINGSYRS